MSKAVQLPPGIGRVVARLALAFALIGLALWIRWTLRTTLGERPLLILFILPILTSAHLGGWSAGALATALAGIATAVFPMPETFLRDPGRLEDWFQWCVMLATGTVATIMVEVLHRAREARHVGERRFRDVVESMPNAIVIVDSAGRMELVNAETERLFGWERRELLGQAVERLMPTDSAKEHGGLLRQYFLAPHQRVLGDGIPLVGRRRDGQSVAVEISLNPLATVNGRRVMAVIRDVEKERQAQERIRESESRYRALVEHAPEAIVLFEIEQGRFVDANDNACRLFGVAKETLLRHGPTDFSPPTQPDGRSSGEAARDYLGRTNSGEQVHFDWVHCNAAGEEIPCEVFLLQIAAETPTLIRGSIIDVSERRRSERAVAASRAMLQLVLDNIPQGVYWKDRESRYLGCNRVVCRFLGVERPESIEHLEEQDVVGVDPVQAGLRIHGDRRVMEDDRARLGIIEFAKSRDGTPLWLETSRVPMHDAQGRVVGMLGTWNDVTERENSSAERQRLEAQLQQAQKMESLGVLAGGIAHDFNNLLTSILGFSDLAMLELPQGSSARMLLAEAVHGALRAAELTKQLLAYSGKGRFVVEPLDLSRVTEEMARLLEVTIPKKCVLTLNLRPDLPAIAADIAQLRQVIMNLVINAAEAIGQSSGHITVTTGVMHCEAAYFSDLLIDGTLASGEYVYIDVADDGEGMSEETRARIFDPFFTTKFTGRGLGLAAVSGIARGHHGAIKCTSRLGVGTTFKVLFPVTSMVAMHVEETPERTPEWHREGVVLIVDDEPSVRDLARHMMERIGFEVLCAPDGLAAIEIFRRDHARIDLVLLDMTMPKLDGEETFRELHAIRGDIKAILSSGYNEQSAISRFSGKGLAAFIQKPYRFEQLSDVVRGVLGDA